MARIDRFMMLNTLRKGFSDYILVYDISANRERRLLQKLVKRYGFRVQKSVFECKMTRRMREELLSRIEQLDIQTGHIRLYKKASGYKVKLMGKRIPRDPDNRSAFII